MPLISEEFTDIIHMMHSIAVVKNTIRLNGARGLWRYARAISLTAFIIASATFSMEKQAMLNVK